MTRSTFLIVLLLCMFTISSCNNSTGPQACTGEAEPAIEVQITDVRTGRYMAKNARGTIEDGSYEDSLRHSHITQTVPTLIVSSLAAGAERAGTYDVMVTLAGYEPWTRTNVKVQEGACGPETQFLQARLRRIDQ